MQTKNDDDRLFYINSKGKEIECRPTRHAYERFAQRFRRIRNQTLDDVTETFRSMFLSANRIQIASQENKRIKKRNQRHGGNTIYLKNNEFTFVVEDRVIKTVEISAKDMRHLN